MKNGFRLNLKIFVYLMVRLRLKMILRVDSKESSYIKGNTSKGNPINKSLRDSSLTTLNVSTSQTFVSNRFYTVSRLNLLSNVPFDFNNFIIQKYVVDK